LKRTYHFLLFIVFCLLALLPACGQAQQDPSSSGNAGLNPESNSASAVNTIIPITRDPITLTNNYGGMTGIIQNINGPIPPGTRVYFAEHTRHPDGWGVYALNTAVTKYVLIDPEGVFQAPDLEPGEYVLVVGIEPETSYIISDEGGEAKIYTVQAGDVLDIGTETVSLQAYDPNASDDYFVPDPGAYPGPNDTPTAYP